MMINPKYAMIAIFILASCVPSNRKEVLKLTSNEIASQVTVSGTKFDSSQTFVSPTVNDGWTDYRIRSWRNSKTQKFQKGHQLYVVLSYGDTLRPKNSGKSWIFYRKASAVGGQTVNVRKIDSKVDCSSQSCFFVEHIGIDLSDGFLESHRNTGFQLRVSAENGNGAQIISVPANIVDGHLKALEKRGYSSSS